MRRNTTLLAIGLVLLISIVTIGLTLLRIINAPIFGPHVREFHVSGVVTDGANGKPVAQARVIVVVWPNRMDAEEHCFGFVTKDDGTFDMRHTTPFSMKNKISILASSPDDGYGEVGSDGIRIVKNTLVSTDRQIKISPAPGRTKKVRYRYSTFCPGCPGAKNLKFLDKGWDIQYYY
jgi:hypothetical protein